MYSSERKYQAKKQLFKILLFVIISIFSFESSAIGHTSVVDTTPKYKTYIQQMPSEISMTFDQPLVPDSEVNFLRFFDPSNNEIEIISQVGNNSISAKLPESDFQRGTYTVRYFVTSIDGHAVNGLYEFYLIEKTSMNNQTITEKHSFFHVHALHIFQFVVVLSLIIIWIVIRYFRKK